MNFFKLDCLNRNCLRIVKTIEIDYSIILQLEWKYPISAIQIFGHLCTHRKSYDRNPAGNRQEFILLLSWREKLNFLIKSCRDLGGKFWDIFLV